VPNLVQIGHETEKLAGENRKIQINGKLQ